MMEIQIWGSCLCSSARRLHCLFFFFGFFFVQDHFLEVRYNFSSMFGLSLWWIIFGSLFGPRLLVLLGGGFWCRVGCSRSFPYGCFFSYKVVPLPFLLLGYLHFLCYLCALGCYCSAQSLLQVDGGVPGISMLAFLLYWPSLRGGSCF